MMFSQPHDVLQVVLLPVLFLLSTTTIRSSVYAYPYAAGQCPAGELAVSNAAHIQGKPSENVLTGTLEEGGLELLLNGQVLLHWADMDSSTFGYYTVSSSSSTNTTTNTLELRSTENTVGGGFKGFLIRLGPPPGVPNSVDLREVLYPDMEEEEDEDGTITSENVQLATATCVEQQQVAGLTHRNSNIKTSVMGIMEINTPVEELSLDVTVVLYNNATAAAHYYSNYRLRPETSSSTGGGDDTTTSTPTTTDTEMTNNNAPSIAPTSTDVSVEEDENSDNNNDSDSDNHEEEEQNEDNDNNDANGDQNSETAPQQQQEDPSSGALSNSDNYYYAKFLFAFVAGLVTVMMAW